MSRLVRLNAQLSVGGEPEPRQLARLAADGFRSVLDLREDFESAATPPAEEAQQLQRQGIDYQRCPISPRTLDPATVDRFRGCLARLTTPLLVHCREGRRSALLTMIHVGIANGWTGDYTLEQARRLGWNFGDSFAADLVRREVDARSRPWGIPRNYGEIVRTPR